MSWPLAIAIYFVIWWTMLFAVLPFGVRTQGEAGEVVPGTPSSAPAAHRMVRVAVITTIASFVLFGVLWLAVWTRVIDLDRGPPPPGTQPSAVGRHG